MKSKSVIPLIIVLAVLVGLIFLKNAKQEQSNIQDRVKALMPADLSKADIAKLVIATGSKPEEAVTLVRDESNTDTWRVASHFNAPADMDKLNGYLDALVGAKGEFRATAPSDEALQQYELNADKAFAIEAYTENAETAAFKLLIGKAPTFQQIFVRMDGQKDVYVLDKDLRAEAGVYSRGEDTPEEAPKADMWLDKKILEFEKSKATRVAFHTPYRDLTLEYKATEAKKDEEAQPQEEDKAENVQAEVAVEQPVETYAWAIAEGGPALELKPTAVDGLVTFLSTLTATDIVDPAKKAEYGLENPAYTCTLSIEGEDVVLEGACPEPGTDGYVRVKDAADDVIYKLAAYNFGRVFGKGSDLFDLAKLDVDAAAMERVAIKAPSGDFVLKKAGEDWSIESPKLDKDVQTDVVNGVINAVAGLNPVDYADSADGKGLEKPERTITIKAGDQTHTIAVGKDVEGFAGAYARFTDDGPVVLLNQADLERIFIPTEQLTKAREAEKE